MLGGLWGVSGFRLSLYRYGPFVLFRSLLPYTVTTESLTSSSLSTEFVTIEIDQPDSISVLPQTIIKSLQAIGDPLRWAITSVSSEKRKLYVEAVVTTKN